MDNCVHHWVSKQQCQLFTQDEASTIFLFLQIPIKWTCPCSCPSRRDRWQLLPGLHHHLQWSIFTYSHWYLKIWQVLQHQPNDIIKICLIVFFVNNIRLYITQFHNYHTDTYMSLISGVNCHASSFSARFLWWHTQLKCCLKTKSTLKS